MWRWTELTEEMPNPEIHPRVLIYTGGYDFGGVQVFDVKADWLNESYFEDEESQPETCRVATHWAPLNLPSLY